MSRAAAPTTSPVALKVLSRPAPRRSRTPGVIGMPTPPVPRFTPVLTWDEISKRAPRIASTMTSYLDQIAVSSRPGTVEAANLALPDLL